MASDRQNLQDAFLNHVRKTKVPVTIFLINGVKLQGVITWFDNFSLLLRRDGQSQLVYKHAISTIMPGQPVDAEQFANQGGNNRQRLLQDVFLSRVSESEVEVTMFLVNGVMLQGRIAAYDLFCVLLERDGFVQLAYKHAVSTIQPASNVDLSVDWEGEEDCVSTTICWRRSAGSTTADRRGSFLSALCVRALCLVPGR